MAYEAIPQDLQALKQWGLFQKTWNEEKKKYDKFPIDAHNGEPAKSNDSNTWVGFQEALAAMERYQADGLAFFFKEPYIGIDIDHVRPEMEEYIAGDFDNIVADFIDHTKSYTESSVSGTGIHIIVKGKFPGKRRRKANVEMYPEGRFFALTGQVFGTRVDEIKEISPEDFQHLYKKYLDPDDHETVQMPKVSNGTTIHLSAQEVVNKALASTQGPLFKKLMDGVIDRYNSHSEADLALCNILAFWTAKDRDLMDEIFRQSKLYRPKWDQRRGKQTYGALTINQAINDTVNVYQRPASPDRPYFTIKSEEKKDDPMLKGMTYSDIGLRNRFLKAYPGIIKYSSDRKKFMKFTGQRWEYVNQGVVYRMLDPVVEKIPLESLPGEDDLDEDEAEALEKTKKGFVKRCRQNQGRSAGIKEVANYTMVDDSQFDQQVGEINTQSGMVNLTNGDIRAVKKSDLVTKLANTEVLNQPTPIWDDFMETIFPDYPELIPFIYRLFGYTILGTVAEQRSVFLLGQGESENGSNGKSTLVQAIFNVLGDYAVNIEPEVLTAGSQMSDSNKDNQIANTKGARLITTSELEENSILNDAMLKRLTGGETITARRLYETPISFVPTGTLWMTSNYMPVIKGTDKGIWRRLIMVPMTANITKKDIHLMDKLMTEKAGIMRHIIDGALDYQANGLQIPDICRKTVGEYKEEMDTVGQFLDDCFDKDVHARTSWPDIAGIYNNWNRINQTGMSLWLLNRKLGKRLKRFHDRNGRGFVGIVPKKKSGMIPLEDRIKHH